MFVQKSNEPAGLKHFEEWGGTQGPLVEQIAMAIYNSATEVVRSALQTAVFSVVWQMETMTVL